MTEKEYQIYKDVFNPNESDLDYFIRRGLQLGILTEKEAENMKSGVITKEILEKYEQ